MANDIRSLMIILAHPDDESFTIGGTLAKYAVEGARITLISATKGELGILGTTPEETGIIRHKELLEAAKMLGISDVRFLGYQDGDLSSANQQEIIAKLISLLQTEQPQVVITFGADGISGHSDHIAISQFVTKAFDQSGIKTRLYYISPSDATLQCCGVPPSTVIPAGIVVGIDIEKYLETKVCAIQCHCSQKHLFLGAPKEEVMRMACHEYFTLVRPPFINDMDLHDLFSSS